jgi:hypothetical protein
MLCARLRFSIKVSDGRLLLLVVILVSVSLTITLVIALLCHRDRIPVPMDLLQEIRVKVEALPEDSRAGPLEVLRHLLQCERLLHQGRQREPEYFNDIIYRTNQAFEGALKEAYRAIESKDPDKITPHKIEQLLARASVVRPKIINLMQNYRTEWRNPSTHDYTMRFDESESILAIASVSAFFWALLGQIEDKIAIKNIEVEAARSAGERPRSNKDSEEPGFWSDLSSFSSAALLFLPSPKDEVLSDRQIELLLVQIINLNRPDWKVTREPVVKTPGGAVLRPDILVEDGAEKAIIEVRRSSGTHGADDRRARGIDQMTRYMRAVGVPHGIIVWVPPSVPAQAERAVSTRETSVHLSDEMPKAVIQEVGLTDTF